MQIKCSIMKYLDMIFGPFSFLFPITKSNREDKILKVNDIDMFKAETFLSTLSIPIVRFNFTFTWLT